MVEVKVQEEEVEDRERDATESKVRVEERTHNHSSAWHMDGMTRTNTWANVVWHTIKRARCEQKKVRVKCARPLVNVLTCYDPIKVPWTGSEKHSKHRTHLIIVLAPIVSKMKSGPYPWQQDLHKTRDALRSATKMDKYTSRCGIGGKMTKSNEQLNWHTIGPTSGSSTSTLSRTSTPVMKHLIGSEQDTTTWSTREAWTLIDKQDHCASVLDKKKQQEFKWVFNILRDTEYLLFH